MTCLAVPKKQSRCIWLLLVVFVLASACSEMDPSHGSELHYGSDGKAKLVFQIGNETLPLHLEPSAAISSELRVSRVQSNGTIHTDAKGLFYQGVAEGKRGSWARVHVVDNQVAGMLSIENSLLQLHGQVGDTIVLHPVDPPVGSHESICGFDHAIIDPHSYYAPHSSTQLAPQAITTHNPRLLEIVLVADFDYFKSQGANTASGMLHALNQVDGIFRETVHTGFVVKEVVVFETADDPFEASRNNGTMLQELRTYRDTHYRTTGAIHLFTKRRLAGKALGVAYSHTLCSSSAVGISRSANVVLVAHEIGHNFGAQHDPDVGCKGKFIMHPNINSSRKFSSCSKESMKKLIDSRPSCFRNPPAILTPTPGTTLPPGPVDFSWITQGQPVEDWELWVGSSLGESDLFASGPLGSTTTVSILDLPIDGRDLYVRLRYKLNGFWKHGDFAYKAFHTTVVPTAIYSNRGRVCEEAGGLTKGEGAVGLGYVTADGFDAIDGQNVTACIAVDFGYVTFVENLRVVARGVNNACGAECNGEGCGTGHQFKTFRSLNGEDFTFIDQTDVTNQLASYPIPVGTAMRVALICRSRTGSARDQLEVDYVEAQVEPISPQCEQCADNAACTVDLCIRDGCVHAPQDIACNDGVSCTIDRCSEEGCTHEPDHEACSNNIFCDGMERCDVNLGCVSGPPPTCGDTERCDRKVDSCVPRHIFRSPKAVEIARGRVCNEGALLPQQRTDKSEESNPSTGHQSATGLGYITSDGFATIDGQNVTGCVQVDYGEVFPIDILQVQARSVNTACGAQCSDELCNTGRQVKAFHSIDGVTFTFLAQVEIKDSPHGENQGHFASINQRQFGYYTIPVDTDLRFAMICRPRTGSARDHLEVLSIRARGRMLESDIR